jgi:DNA-binding NtrC family response regulator
MMLGSRLALVSNDQRLAEAIQAHLQKTLGQTPFTCAIEEIRSCLAPDTDGLLLLATDQAADAEKILRLVHEMCIEKLPPIVLIVEGDAVARQHRLNALEGRVAHRVRWPEEAATLVSLVKSRMGKGRHFTKADEESLEEVIRRRLLNRTPSLQGLAEQIALAARHDVPVLLSGETGTGKTYLARLMHECSPRRNNRFLVVSCGTLAPNLIESEFFGHVKGAFTGADHTKEGKFAAAGHGTLLLDEIDTLGLQQQSNLLRILETGEFEPVGSNQTQVCTARIIAASNWNLEEAVDSGKFRRDLYYRLHVMAFHLPPLRERIQDIPPLVRGMAAHFNTKFRKELFGISNEAMAALEAFPWPGNIRQLENVVQQAVLMSSGPELLPTHLPPLVRSHQSNGSHVGQPRSDSLAHNRQEMERMVIQRTLASCRNCRTDAAHALGISRVTLYKKMRKYGLMNRTAQTAG